MTDEQSRQARLVDLAINLAAGDYPVVTCLVFKQLLQSPQILPWSQVQDINWAGREIRIASLDAGDAAGGDEMDALVLLNRDVLDALVLDLQERRATRANDLWLEAGDGQLWLAAADTSAWGVLRRLSGGRLRHIARGALYDWKYVEFLRGDPQAARHGRDYHTRITHLPPGEIARLSDALPYLHAAELLTLLPDPIAADTLEALSPERQIQVFEEMHDDRAKRLLKLMRPDIVADLLGRLEPGDAQDWLERLPAAQRERVLALLRYPEDTAGGIMTNDVIMLPAQLTADEALVQLRDLLKRPDFVNFIYDIYVVDDDASRKLVGAIALRDLLAADADTRLVDIMDSYVMVLYPLQPAEDAARRVIDSESPGLPVIARDRVLLGVVPVDAALALAVPASWRSQAPRLFS